MLRSLPFKGFERFFFTSPPLRSLTVSFTVLLLLIFTSSDSQNEEISHAVNQFQYYHIPYLCKITPINSTITGALLSGLVDLQVLVPSLCRCTPSSIQNSRGRVARQACQEVLSVRLETRKILVRDAHKLDERESKSLHFCQC